MGKMIDISADKSIEAYLASPAEGAKGAIIVIHEVWGLTGHIKSVADRYASEGYIALAPGLLSNSVFDSKKVAELQKAIFDPARRNSVQPELRQLMAPMQEPDFGELTVSRLQACFDYLYKLPEAHQKVAVNGFCFGGTYSFSLAIVQPKIVIALPFYGHSDQPVDELKNITCPVHAFFGQNDERLISQLPDLKKRMKAAGVDFTAKAYPNCGHAFFNDSNPLAHNKAAATDAWATVLSLLSEVMNR
ncbi:MAG TPA: dienelactone hydrolase family protein [Candidatus Binatia bacterium]|nr:dienelactone hydrolase family protein [Candidatus Binatia bacterium]